MTGNKNLNPTAPFDSSELLKKIILKEIKNINSKATIYEGNEIPFTDNKGKLKGKKNSAYIGFKPSMSKDIIRIHFRYLGATKGTVVEKFDYFVNNFINVPEKCHILIFEGDGFPPNSIEMDWLKKKTEEFNETSEKYNGNKKVHLMTLKQFSTWLKAHGHYNI